MREKKRRNRCQGRTYTAFNLPTSSRRGAGGCRCGEIMVISDAMDCQAFAANRIRSSRLAFNHRSIPSFTGRATLAASHGLRGGPRKPECSGQSSGLGSFFLSTSRTRGVAASGDSFLFSGSYQCASVTRLASSNVRRLFNLTSLVALLVWADVALEGSGAVRGFRGVWGERE